MASDFDHGGIPMQALVYVSTATRLPSDAVVGDILATAHRENPRFGLTGMLLWKDMTFAQLLEGPEESLDRLWARLVADDRHEDLRLLSRWDTDHRFFGEWSMASRELNAREHWELLERPADEPDEEFCAWLLYLMNEVHRSARLR
jgi:hypothetical protein